MAFRRYRHHLMYERTRCTARTARDSAHDHASCGDAVNGVAHNVTAEAHADCPFSIAQEYAVDYLRRAKDGLGVAEIRLPIRFLPAVLHRRVTLTFGLHFDTVEGGRAHDEIRVRWTSGTPLLPNFRGAVRFRIDGTGTIVVVEGTYDIPFGIAGRCFDAVIGRSIAQSSMRDLAERIATSLESDQRDWRAHIAAPNR